MSSLQKSDVHPGLVVRVDTSVLRARGDSFTNAQVTGSEDRAVTGVHDFLVLQVEARSGLATAIPIFPRSAPGSAPLDDGLRSGPAEWMSAPVYYSRWQHWRIPVDALAEAAVAADADEARRYAPDKADVLQDLANWSSRNRCVFRPA